MNEHPLKEQNEGTAGGENCSCLDFREFFSTGCIIDGRFLLCAIVQNLARVFQIFFQWKGGHIFYTRISSFNDAIRNFPIGFTLAGKMTNKLSTLTS